jgi:peptidoglycan biosynthesis protein MviN/MurJ (putative lipid II flippase)
VHRTVLVSAFTLLSRVLGYLRESVMAAIFNDASTVNDVHHRGACGLVSAVIG